ncbi:hypothetical protein HJG60_010315 [Phyllostomus discolor]|uniref:Uncharacterized protein n=1 Tax=Phyllostomus discolor TaxID=89673 RepID=A0A834AYD0_9CHIR|nr:hypothetical protein HJG60_010315 [Phyllostomus discolor]
MCDQPRFLPGSSAASPFSTALQAAVPQTCHVLKPGAFDSAGPAAGEILPLPSYIIQCLTFFRSPPNVTSSEKSSLQTIFQIVPSCTNPIPSLCFTFLHHISNYTQNISYVKFLLSVSLFPARIETI